MVRGRGTGEQKMEMEEAQDLYERAMELRPQRAEFRNAVVQFSGSRWAVGRRGPGFGELSMERGKVKGGGAGWRRS